jgi:acyl dehydratase
VILAELVGQTAERRIAISDAAIRSFADLISDHNPLHLDAEAAAAGRFGKPIAHGMLLASLFSGILGEDLPGPGTIYLSQNVTFRRPVFVGQTVRVRVLVEAVDVERGRVHLETTVFDADGEPCVIGDAWVLIDAPQA